MNGWRGKRVYRVRMTAAELKTLVQESFSKWNDDDVPRLSASLAFYTVLSLAPLLLIAVAVAGFAVGTQAARNEVLQELGGLVGDKGRIAIQGILESAYSPGKGVFSILVGVITLIVGASGVFGELQSSLDFIWGVKPREGRGWWAVVRDRFFSFLLVLGSAFLLLVSLVVTTVLAGIAKFAGHLLPWPHSALEGLNFVISFFVIGSIFALIFKYVPDVVLSWRDVRIGAAVSSLLFLTGKFFIGLYLGRSTMGSLYGAAGSLVILLAWVYYSAQVVFLGAEFTQVYSQRCLRGNKEGANVETIVCKPQALPIDRAA